MELVTANTPEGIVFRRIFASGEEAWRYHANGTWAHCADHKGPWVSINIVAVPASVLFALKDLKEICAQGADTTEAEG